MCQTHAHIHGNIGYGVLDHSANLTHNMASLNNQLYSTQ